MSDEKPKRKPAGAAVPGAVERPVNYPHTLVIMISDEMQKALTVTADENGVKKAVVARDWLEVGRQKGGHFIDETGD
jgi:hypothetical protein